MSTQVPESHHQEDTGLAEEQRIKTQAPRKYKVLLHNDDYTTMEFVVEVLVQFFHKSETEATQIMLSVHHRGVGVCGLFTREVAETKVAQVMDHARKHEMPLKCTMEAE
jgi:ATP-dependent Clp protease adaptor protein ClpS